MRFVFILCPVFLGDFVQGLSSTLTLGTVAVLLSFETFLEEYGKLRVPRPQPPPGYTCTTGSSAIVKRD